MENTVEIENATDKDIEQLFKDLEEKSIKELHIYNSVLSSQIIYKLCEKLSYNKTIKSLTISYCKINDNDLKIICRSLLVNITLTKLWLSHNEISDNGTEYLKDLLVVNQTLKILNLSNNNIGNDGAFNISQGLLFNTSIKELHLSKNPIDEQGIQQLRDSVRFNPFINRLSAGEMVNLVHTEFKEERSLAYQEFIESDEYNEMIKDLCNSIFENYPTESISIVRQYKNSIVINVYNKKLIDCLSQKVLKIKKTPSDMMTVINSFFMKPKKGKKL